MTINEALRLVQGFEEPESEEHIISAWQHLHDTGAAYVMDHWLKPTVLLLLDLDIITDKNTYKTNY